MKLVQILSQKNSFYVSNSNFSSWKNVKICLGKKTLVQEPMISIRVSFISVDYVHPIRMIHSFHSLWICLLFSFVRCVHFVFQYMNFIHSNHQTHFFFVSFMFCFGWFVSLNAHRLCFCFGCVQNFWEWIQFIFHNDSLLDYSIARIWNHHWISPLLCLIPKP
jgi:hypothetical protein